MIPLFCDCIHFLSCASVAALRRRPLTGHRITGDLMLWVKAFHIIAVICWFAAIFYLPRLFVYHASAEDQVSKDRFVIMERKLYRGIATPSAIATVILPSLSAHRAAQRDGQFSVTLDWAVRSVLLIGVPATVTSL